MSIFNKIKTGINEIPGLLTKEFTIGKPVDTGEGFSTDDLRSNIEVASDFIPGREILQGLAVNSFAKDAHKKQESIDDRQEMLRSSSIKMLRSAREEGDSEKEERVKKILTDMGEDEPDRFIDEILGKAPTTQQIIGDAAEAVTFTALSGVKGLQGAGKLLTREAKLQRKINKLKKSKALKDASLGKKLRIRGTDIAREAGIGSALFASIEAQMEDATTEDIIRAGEMGAVLGPAFMAVVTGVIKGTSKLVEKTGKGVRFLEDKAQEVVAKASDDVVEGTSQIDKTLSLIGEKVKPKTITARTFLKTTQGARQFGAKIVDRHLPLRRIETNLEESLGRPLKESEKVYRDARLLESVSNAEAERRVVQLQDELRPFNDIMDEASAYLTQLDLIDRAKLGQTVAGGQSLKQLQTGLKNIVKEVGPDDMKRLGKVRGTVRKYHKDLLQDRLEAGLITKKEMDTLLKTHPNYIPHNVIMDIEERAVRGVGGSFNVSRTDLMKAVGSSKNIQNPFAATIQRTPITTRVIEKNKLLRNIVRAQEKNNVIPGMRKMKKGQRVKDLSSTEDVITFFRDGKKEKWIVPKDMGVAIKNLDTPIDGPMLNIVAGVQGLLKKGATQFNLSFAVPNKFRDMQTAALTSEAFIESMAKRTGVTPKAVDLGKDTIQKLYKESGGFGASIFREGEDKIFKRMQKAGVGRKVPLDKNPFKTIEKINESFEQQTRMEVFRRGLERGLNPKDAAMVSRDATIDFARMGSWMRPVNRAIPFLNARVQGFINLPRAMKANPESFARMQLWTGVYPTMLLHQHNRRYDAYDNVGQYWKNKYWVIMLGQTKTTDAYNGNETLVPHFITVPKGEGQTLVSSPIQWYLERLDGRDYRKGTEMLADTIGAATPLEFQSFNQDNFFQSITSQLGPAATVPLGLATNQNLFYGREIIPEDRLEARKDLQFRPQTPESTKALADTIGVAPANLEFALNSFGGLPQDIQDSVDIAFGLWKGEDMVEDLQEESLSRTVFGIGTRTPLARRFMREASEFYSPESEFRRRQKQKITEDVVSTSVERRDRAEEIVREINKRETVEEKDKYINSLGDELDNDMRKKVKMLQSRRDTIEALRKNDPVDVRARYIIMRLDEMEQFGISDEDKDEYLNELTSTGILTNDVRKTIFIIRNNE